MATDNGRLDGMIYDRGGVWLQTRAPGEIRTCYVGRLSLTSVQEFCAKHKLRLWVVRDGSAGDKHP